ncbi:hypothetical protein SPHINGOT1_80221 [Sphingomonas sp. T1]|nr:hypothetical protein SPHINGOT1_80221 [Sphingomonas sp. T1]
MLLVPLRYLFLCFPLLFPYSSVLQS